MSELQAVYELSYWVTLSLLSIMVVLIGSSFLVRWTRLPVDPSTIAGAMYFVVDSNLVGELDGLETRNGRQQLTPNLRNRKVIFRKMTGASGEDRTQVMLGGTGV